MAADQEQIDGLATIIRAELISKGMTFGTFEPDYLALTCEAYAKIILDYGGGGSEGSGGINWDLVEISDIMNVISGEIKASDLFSDLQTTINKIPSISELTENILSNTSDLWDETAKYRTSQIVNYGGILYECTAELLVPPYSNPSLDTGHWKTVGTYNDVYDLVDGISTRIFAAKSAADGAASDVSSLSSTVLGDDGTALSDGLIFDERSVRSTNEEVVVAALNALCAELFGPDGAANVTGYITTDSNIDISETTTSVDLSSIIGGRIGDAEAAIQTEQNIRAVVTGPDYEEQDYTIGSVVTYGDQLFQNTTAIIDGGHPWEVSEWKVISKSLYAEYTVKLDVNGFVSGFGLANDGATSSFIVNADTFAIDHPNNTEGTVIPFIVQDNKVWMDSAFIKDLSAQNFVGGKVIADELIVGGLLWGDVMDKPIELQDGSFQQLAEDSLTLATNSGEIVNDLPGLQDGVQNFNYRNDRISVTPEDPTILSDGTAIDFSFNNDGSSNIDFAWEYGTGTDATNVDGFLVYVKADSTDTVHDLSTDLSETTFFQIQIDKSQIRLLGLTSDKYYTIGIEAFRVVDQDVNETGILRSNIVQPSHANENPIFLDLNVPAPDSVTITEY